MQGVISIHIPKTAGRSFLHILRQIYPVEKVAHFDLRDFPSMDRGSATRSFLNSLDKETVVIHGHYFFSDIADYQRTNGMRLVTWLREPVERVLSNYRFFIKRARAADDEDEISDRRNESLMEYARMEGSRNRMSKFLEGTTLEAVDFVGITEHFSDEVKALGKALGWGEFKVPELNVNLDYRTSELPKIKPAELDEIRELNQDDIELYDMALELRQKRDS